MRVSAAKEKQSVVEYYKEITSGVIRAKLKEIISQLIPKEELEFFLAEEEIADQTIAVGNTEKRIVAAEESCVLELLMKDRPLDQKEARNACK